MVDTRHNLTNGDVAAFGISWIAESIYFKSIRSDDSRNRATTILSVAIR